MRIFLLLVSFTVFFSSSTFAVSTVECHCFQDRQYTPGNSPAADPYFLATTQNSLMAVLFGVEKRSLVKAKMSGHTEENLWIAHTLADQSGKTVAAVSNAYSDRGGWPETVKQLGIAPEQLTPRFFSLLNNPEELTAMQVDEALKTHLRTPEASLATLRSIGASNQERILATLVGRIRGADPVVVYRQVTKGESWGKLLYQQGVFDGATIEKKWRQLLTK